MMSCGAVGRARGRAAAACKIGRHAPSLNAKAGQKECRSVSGFRAAGVLSPTACD